MLQIVVELNNVKFGVMLDNMIKIAAEYDARPLFYVDLK